MENSCPQCKKKIHHIIYKDILGRDRKEYVDDKVQEVDNFEDLHCEGCSERIYERNFDGANRDRDTAAICEECLEQGKHLRCMDEEEKDFWESD